MLKHRKKILILGISALLTIVFFPELVSAEGCQYHNVYGWAWSENIGWISFSCQNCDSDLDGNLDGGACGSGSSVDYGVHIDPNTGLFSGYAWSENIGWISFNDFDSSHPQTQLDLNNGEVSGWARALANGGGWDGWIKLRGLTNETPPKEYGVWLDSSNYASLGYSEFREWAWGSDVVGWVSFNRSNTGATADYKVMTDVNINPVPSATGLNVEEGNYCNCAPGQTTQCSGSKDNPPIYLKWTFDDPGDSQKEYMIEIDEDSRFGSPRGCPEQAPYRVNTEGTSGPDYSCTPQDLAFGKTYYWRIKVWDSQGAESGWINAPVPFSTDIRWPNTKFTPSLTNPSAGVEVTFTDESTCYSGAADCSDANYVWDFEYDGTFDPTYFSKEGATKTYTGAGDYIVRLEVTSSSNMCPAVFPLTAALPLPTWREAAPF